MSFYWYRLGRREEDREVLLFLLLVEFNTREVFTLVVSKTKSFCQAKFSLCSTRGNTAVLPHPCLLLCRDWESIRRGLQDVTWLSGWCGVSSPMEKSCSQQGFGEMELAVRRGLSQILQKQDDSQSLCSILCVSSFHSEWMLFDHILLT